MFFCGELIIPKGEHFWLFFYFCNLHHYKDVIADAKRSREGRRDMGRYKSNDFLHILAIISYNYIDKKIINQSMVKGEIQ